MTSLTHVAKITVQSYKMFCHCCDNINTLRKHSIVSIFYY